MKILMVTQGACGERIVGNIRKRAPADWEIEAVSLPMGLPVLMEDPEEFIPGPLPQERLVCMHYPCLGSMQMKQIDKGLYNTLMHLSGQILNEQMEPHLTPFLDGE